MKLKVTKPATVKAQTKPTPMTKDTIKLGKLSSGSNAPAAPSASPKPATNTAAVAPPKGAAAPSSFSSTNNNMAVSIEIKELPDNATIPGEMGGHENLMIDESKEVKMKTKAAKADVVKANNSTSTTTTLSAKNNNTATTTTSTAQ